MNRLFHIFIILFINFFSAFPQIDEIWLDSYEDLTEDTVYNENYTDPKQIEQSILTIGHGNDEIVLGGYISSIFHESIDSARVLLSADGILLDSVYSKGGKYSFTLGKGSNPITIALSHPDFYNLDTTIYLQDSDYTILHLMMEPKYKVYLRGRVFAGNTPLEGVMVNIRHAGKSNDLMTRGCFYDKEGYWNCLFLGMFRYNLITANLNDSVYISLSKEGMKPYSMGMIVKDYTGEIMNLKMKYNPVLPAIPKHNLNLKISFPMLSLNDDWFVGFSAYRLLGNGFLRRAALGIEADVYITTITVSHPTFINLGTATSDSAYIHPFLGPSVLFWIVPPEKRYFSTYTGCTFAYNFSTPGMIFQPFAGTRMFLDLNKAINVELRYAGYRADVVHYIFNGYGDAARYKMKEIFEKLSLNIGIQVAF